MASDVSERELAAVRATERWLDEWVIGLGLCPFAHPVRRAGLIRTVATGAAAPEGVLMAVADELERLVGTPRSELATTLIVLSRSMTDFEAFNALLDPVDALVDHLDLRGVVQVASFHPDYRFADAAREAVGNYTNRSPYPTLHLIREADIADAVENHPNVEQVPADNVARLEAMGIAEVRRRLLR